ncbi:MAG: zf-TFIIB domain-containing protein [Pyrinomonadaceae bacterium]
MPIDLEDRGQALENEYFYRKEQELIAKMKAKLGEEESKSLEIQCPKCDGTLVEADFQNIKIDICNGCSGVWLDPGELTLIVGKEDEESGWFGKLFG